MSSSGLLRKRETITIKQPIPGFIPLKFALDVLHDHSGVITMNPLVIDHKPRSPPRDAPADEYHCTWYEIFERIQYVPGLGKMGSGKIHFNGCFHSTSWGLQTHIYAPMNVDMRTDYKIVDAGQPESATGSGKGGLGGMVPIGLGTVQPTDEKTESGLYLRADIRFECNKTLVSFVRSQCQSAIKEMVTRMVKKAEALDADVLAKMFTDSRPVIGGEETPPMKELPPAKEFAVELPGSYDFDENSLGNLQLSGKRQLSQPYVGQQYHSPSGQSVEQSSSSHSDQSRYSRPISYAESSLPAELPSPDEPKPPFTQFRPERPSNPRPVSFSRHQSQDRPVSYAEQPSYKENKLPDGSYLPYNQAQQPYKDNQQLHKETYAPYRGMQTSHNEIQQPHRKDYLSYKETQPPYNESQQPNRESYLPYKETQNRGEQNRDDRPSLLFNTRSSYSGQGTPPSTASMRVRQESVPSNRFSTVVSDDRQDAGYSG